ncbi:HemK/PrmC family methyltransferase [Micromonospora sp. DH15]|nr:HemK/PrmC family methyltransferase [Micromonospora sp. DH15]
MTSLPQHPSEGSERLRPTVAVARAARVLAAAGIDAPRVEAELLAVHVLGVPRGRLALADGLTPDQLDRYDALVARRADREPLQHLTGSAAFRHLELAVGPGVFVPRPETELLAGWGVDQARAGGPVVVDLCSGSGAIALAVAQEAPAARVVAVERSPGVLRPGGVLGVEHDDTHGAAVPALLVAAGRFEAVEEHRDLAGRPRFATARRR